MGKQKYKLDKYNNSSLLIENKKLSKEYKRQVKFMIVSVFFVTIAMISSAYAIFSDVQRQESDNTLTVGKLKIDFIDNENGMGNIINLNGAYPVSDSDGNDTSPYIFKITNSGTLDANYKVKIIDDTEVITEDGCSNNQLAKNKIRVSINKGTPFTLSDKEFSNYIIDQGSLLKNTSKTYEIRIWISDQSGNEVLGKHYHGKIVIEGENVIINENIVGVYAYDDVNDVSKCITGEEFTCVSTKCHENRNENSCPIGTIVKYKVKDNDIKYFYVLHDNGATMTLQQRENTINNVSWHASDAINSNGPDTLLTSLEQATSTWTNANQISYEPGVTMLYQSIYTGCSATDNSQLVCDSNVFTSSVLGIRTAKSRLISGQEINNTTCKKGPTASCPSWMSNDSNNLGYWVYSAEKGTSNNAWMVSKDGYVSSMATTTALGARAVIEINK